jgi:uncharacterized protein YsxB (DUF464 family)
MYAEHLLTPLGKVVLLVGAVAAAIAGGALGGQGAGGALEAGTAWVTERCGGVDMARTATLDAAWALDVPPSLFGANVHLDVGFQERESAGALRSLNALALFVATVPLPDDVRATVDAQVGAILAARATLLTAGAPIETLEQRLAALVDCLDELEATLVGALGVASSPRGADAILAATLLTRASGDFVDGLRYLAGRVRLYGRGALRTECAAILWCAADAACDGETERAWIALTELRAALVETSPTAFQRSRLDAAVSKVDSLLGDGPRRGGNVAFGSSGAASLFGALTDWTARVTRETGTVPTARSTEMAWTASSEMDVPEAQMEAVVEARMVGHDDAAARDGDVVNTSAEVTAEFTVGGVDAEANAEADVSIGVRVERQCYAFEFDREIPASDAAAAERGVSDLLADVTRLGLPGAVAGRLVAPLNRAHLALWEGRTADAVTALGQFRDQVWKEAFGGALGEGAAADLAAAAEDLLPRREETTWTVPASIAGALGDWSGTIDVEWVRRAAPSDSLVERTDSVVSLRAKREVEGAALSVDAQARRVDYPHDAAKGYRQSQFAGGVSDDGDGPLEVELGAVWTSTFYALDPSKDKRVADLSLDIAFAEAPWDLALSVSESKVEYPNDPGRDERTGAWEIGVDAAFVGGTLEVAWASEWPSTAPGRETAEIFRVEFDASGAKAIDVHLAAEAVGTKRAEEGGACRWALRWEVGVDVDF